LIDCCLRARFRREKGERAFRISDFFRQSRVSPPRGSFLLRSPFSLEGKGEEGVSQHTAEKYHESGEVVLLSTTTGGWHHLESLITAVIITALGVIHRNVSCDISGETTAKGGSRAFLDGWIEREFVRKGRRLGKPRLGWSERLQNEGWNGFELDACPVVQKEEV
jgi:hypothetical protein